MCRCQDCSRSSAWRAYFKMKCTPFVAKRLSENSASSGWRSHLFVLVGAAVDIPYGGLGRGGRHDLLGAHFPRRGCDAFALSERRSRKRLYCVFAYLPKATYASDFLARLPLRQGCLRRSCCRSRCSACVALPLKRGV